MRILWLHAARFVRCVLSLQVATFAAHSRAIHAARCMLPLSRRCRMVSLARAAAAASTDGSARAHARRLSEVFDNGNRPPRPLPTPAPALSLRCYPSHAAHIFDSVGAVPGCVPQWRTHAPEAREHRAGGGCNNNPNGLSIETHTHTHIHSYHPDAALAGGFTWRTAA